MTDAPYSPMHRSAPRGFTLIELLVVILVIVILLGIGFGVGAGLSAGNSDRITRTILVTAELMATEYRVLVDEDINHLALDPLGIPTPLFDWTTPKVINSPNTRPVDGVDIGTELQPTNRQDTELDIQTKTGARFLWVMSRMKRMQRLLAQMPEDAVRDLPDEAGATDGFLDLVDAWDNPIIYVAYVVEEGSNDHIGDDFLPLSDQPYFASAGPDGLWGDAYLLEQRLAGNTLNAGDNELADQAMDNLYSFDSSLQIKN